MTSTRLITSLALLAALALYAASAWIAPSQTQRLISELAGTRTYSVLQAGEPVGYLRSLTEQTPEGDWVMEQQLQIDLLNAPPYTSSQRLTFAGTPPHELLNAHFSEQRQAQLQQITLARTTAGMVGHIVRNNSSEPVGTELDFSLTDQLSLESQLSANPEVGKSYTYRYLDVQRLRVDQRQQQLTNFDGISYTLTSPESDNVTQLDNRLQLIRFDAPDQFSFRLAKGAVDELPLLYSPAKEIWSKELAIAPLSQNLTAPQDLSSLTLALSTRTQRTVAEQGLPPTLSADQTPKPAPRDPQLFLGPSLNLPVGHPGILALLSQEHVAPITTITSAQEIAQQLIDQTRAQLIYRENRPAGSVLAAIESGQGECVDFADLLTTLARSQGIASRTVYGVAYSALPQPGFRFHAWNEIWHEQAWHAVDPTWDQAMADATHLPLDDQTLGALGSAMQRQSITLTPIAWRY
jgi:transglutaminase-like putative cysteine protease